RRQGRAPARRGGGCPPRQCNLLGVDRLHHRRGAATPALSGPGEGQPASFIEAPLPLPLDVLVLFLPVPPHPPVAPLRGQVGIEPAADLGPERPLFGPEAQVHSRKVALFW